jgi:hypothetical protein
MPLPDKRKSFRAGPMLGREWKALLVLKCNYSQRYGNYGQYTLCRALSLGILHAGSAAQQKVIQMVTYAKKWGVKVEGANI